MVIGCSVVESLKLRQSGTHDRTGRACYLISETASMKYTIGDEMLFFLFLFLA
ncbi:MAG: hypothetical protein FKGGLIKP_00801 [Sodalis sp. Fse]|nr:MAG: hypothetical protein FKGGLIKP_00801 [Sodalis sp. Fse]